MTIAAISVDSSAESAALADKLGLSLPLLADPDRREVRAFGVEDEDNGIAWPAIFLVAPDGRVAWRSLSETYKVRAGVAEMLDAIARLPSTERQ